MTVRLSPDQATRAIAKGNGKQPESAILKAIRQYLTAFGWHVVRIQQGMGCHKGIADLHALRNGRSVWIEVKTPTGRQSEHQRAFEREVTAHGGEYIVARCVEDVVAMSGEAVLL